MKRKRFLLIAGHGQGDPGAVTEYHQESVMTRELVSALSDLLKPYADVDVFDINKNMYKFLKTNSFDFTKYDYVFEGHFNACVNDTTGDGETTGTEILVHPSEKATTVEDLILKNISRLGFENRGVKKNRYDLQNMNICKGKQGVSYALLETCFIDDIDDIKLYMSLKKNVAEAIANGIIEGFGLEKSDKFDDIAECYGRQHINELAEMGIINGKGDGKFYPKEYITREDIAIMIRNTIKYIKG